MSTPVLEACNISRHFGQVTALENVNFRVYPGEICALIGDNGAGKSTLVKILSGADRPDNGMIKIDGQPVTFSSPAMAQRQGISTVYQDLALAPELTPVDNLFLGREELRPGLFGKLGLLDRPSMRRKAVGQFDRLGVALRSLKVPISTLSGGQRQSVAIARAAMWANRVIFLDEPTAALGVIQTERVLELIRQVRASGIAVVLISHNMPQVLEIADRVEVLRLGRSVGQLPTAGSRIEDLITAMTSGVAAKEPL